MIRKLLWMPGIRPTHVELEALGAGIVVVALGAMFLAG